MKGREGPGEERKGKMGRKGKRREKEREREGETWPLFQDLRDYGEDKFAQNGQGEVRFVLRYGTKKTECLRPRQVKQYFREAVSQEPVSKDGEEFSRNRDVISRGRQQHLEKSRVMETTWDC